MLDIALFRADKGGNPDLVRESQRRRFENVEEVDKIIAQDEEWRKIRAKLDQANAAINKANAELTEVMKGKASKEEKEAMKAAKGAEKEELKKVIAAAKIEETEAKNLLDKMLQSIGNIVHESVPVSNTEDDNQTLRVVGECLDFTENGKFHHELLAMIDGYDPERGVKVAGHRAYFLKGWGVRLQLALVAYATSFLASKGYTVMQAPYFMNKDIMAETAELAQFDEELYKVTGDDEKYLIATSEQPISAFHRGEWLQSSELPIHYCGYSACFRKEAGSHGKDTWGIFRVHQFEKVEQFVICSPEESWDIHENMVKHSEEFYKSLGIPYRVIAIVSSALNKAAAKKYDIEAWFPRYKEFREVVSCSNCTDYQSRRMEIRLRSKKQGNEKSYVHMLNGTLCATTRTICAILENFQTPEGIVVPSVLYPYLQYTPVDGKPLVIPYTKECPKPKAAITKKA